MTNVVDFEELERRIAAGESINAACGGNERLRSKFRRWRRRKAQQVRQDYLAREFVEALPVLSEPVSRASELSEEYQGALFRVLFRAGVKAACGELRINTKVWLTLMAVLDPDHFGETPDKGKGAVAVEVFEEIQKRYWGKDN